MRSSAGRAQPARGWLSCSPISSLVFTFPAVLQGLCASCWAMTSASVTESVAAIKGGMAPGTKLSPQALKNCATERFL